MSNVYILKDGQQLGPFTEDQIKEGMYQGRYKGDDMAWKEGTADWQPINDLLGGTPAQSPSIPAPTMPFQQAASTKKFTDTIKSKTPNGPIYIFKNGKPVGPFSENEITDAIYQGKFKVTDLAKREGLTDWQPLETLFAGSLASYSQNISTNKRASHSERPPVDHDFEDWKADNIGSCLADTKFNKFITIRLSGLIYQIFIFIYLMLTVSGLVYTFHFYTTNTGSEKFFFSFCFFLGSVALPLILLILVRISMEFLLAMIKTAENTRKIVEALRNQ